MLKRSNKALRSLAVSAAGAAMTLCSLGAGTAHADTYYGTNSQSRGSGTAACYGTQHQLNVDYTVNPALVDVSGMNSILTNLQPEGAWVEVWAYVKPVGGATWTNIGHTQGFAGQKQSVFNRTIYGTPGVRYNVGFYVRFALPGQQWSPVIWDPYVSYYNSNQIYVQGVLMSNGFTAQAGSCMT